MRVAPPSALESREQRRSDLADLRELITAGEAERDMPRARRDPALEPLRAALDRSGVRGLARHDRLRGCCVVLLEELVQSRLGATAVGMQRERYVGATGHGAGRTTGLARGRLDARKMLREEFDARAGRKPRVEARGLAERRRSAAADPDRRAALPVGFRLDGDVVEREVLAAEAH